MSEDKKVPKLRFPGFTDDWEKYNIDQIFNFISTNSFSRKYLNDNKGEVKNIHYGDIHTKFPTIVDCSTEYIPFINENVNLSKIKPEQYCKNGDLIIADASEDYEDIGKPIELTNIDGIKIISGLHTILLRDNSKNTVLGFKGYYFSNPKLKKQIKIIANGISVLGIGKNDLSKISIKIPCKSEQEKIVKFLFKIDKKIIFLKSNLDNCQKFKKYLLQNLFPKNNESAPKLRFKNENGEIFKDWTYKYLDKITFYQEGPGVRTRQYTKEGIKLLNVGNFINNKLDLSTTDRYISKEEAYGIYKHFLVDEGDLLIACSGIKAEYFDEKIAFAKKEHLPLCMNTSTMRFKTLNDNILNLNYLKYVFQTENFKKQVFRILTGSAQFNFGPTHIKYFKIPLPSIEEQEKIISILYTVDRKIELIRNQINKMEEFKKGLLQQMFV